MFERSLAQYSAAEKAHLLTIYGNTVFIDVMRRELADLEAEYAGLQIPSNYTHANLAAYVAQLGALRARIEILKEFFDLQQRLIDELQSTR